MFSTHRLSICDLEGRLPNCYRSGSTSTHLDCSYIKIMIFKNLSEILSNNVSTVSFVKLSFRPIFLFNSYAYDNAYAYAYDYAYDNVWILSV